MNFKTISIIASKLGVHIAQEFYSNERLRWICASAIAVLYLIIIIFWSNVSEESKYRFLSNQSKLSVTSMRADEIGWGKRASDSKMLAKELKQRMWKGSTPGLAEAGFERWIRQTLLLHGIKVKQVTLTRSPLLNDSENIDTIASIEALRARVIAPLNESALIKFVSDASKHQSLIVIEKLFIRGGRNDRLEMDLSTFYNNKESIE